MRQSRFASGVATLLLCGALVPMPLEAQGSAKELIADLKSGDATRCMNAGNATSDQQDHYQQLAAELAPGLFDILENGPCSSSALTALVNVGPDVAKGIDNAHAMQILGKVIENGLAETASPDATSEAGSAVLVIGNFGAGGAPTVPILTRWVLERPDSSDRRYGLMALAAIGDASAPAVPKLLPFLARPADDDEHAYEKKDVRTEVARTLGSIPAAVAVSAPALVAALGDDDYGYRETASDSIRKLGAPMVPYLLPVLKSSDAETKQTLLRLLGGMGASAADAAPEIAPLLTNEAVSYEAGDALRQIGPTPAAIAALVKVLGIPENEDAATAAATILGEYGSAAKDALPALRQAASSKNWSTADAAKTAIAAIGAN